MGAAPVYSEANLMQVRRWKVEWFNSPALQQRFPSLATFLVYSASECQSFQRHRSRVAEIGPRSSSTTKDYARHKIPAVH